ncbi:MAG: radical SAM family heme chaperone HemW [Ezakiella sp.]|nr:radical SAM family heme chaperone HemW [Ezakiella sp.]
MIGLYIHIPFCKHKCSYCDFLTMIPHNSSQIEEYVQYLKKEIIITADFYAKKHGRKPKIDTIYFGGGTPSLLKINMIESMVELIKNYFYLDDDNEITIEINPETIDEKWIKSLYNCGVNRASVGFQNSNKDILKLLGRAHSTEEFLSCVEYLNKYNIGNISADIILSLPWSNLENTLIDAKLLCSLDIKHISAYSLIIEEKTKLYSDIKNKRLIPVSDELDRLIYHTFSEYLSNNGFHRYEISSFAKEGYESRHNKKYWDLTEYFGLGLGASGFIDGARTKNPTNLKDYYKKINDKTIINNIEYHLTKNDTMSEYAFLSIRRSTGIDRKEFKEKFNIEFDNVFDLSKHLKNGLVYEEKDHIILTEKGMDLSNQVEVDLIL